MTTRAKHSEIQGQPQSFDTIPIDTIERCDMLVVPGGHGVLDAMRDAKLLRHLRRLSDDANHVVSICTGSLLLGAAGPLAGRRSACHWAWRDLLSEFPDVTPDPGRVVHDGKFWTSGGVTSGIDVALSVLAEVVDGDFAQSVQLTVEYAPDPPFVAGRPESAPAHVLKLVKERLAESGNARLEAVRHAAPLLVGPQTQCLATSVRVTPATWWRQRRKRRKRPLNTDRLYSTAFSYSMQVADSIARPQHPIQGYPHA